MPDFNNLNIKSVNEQVANSLDNAISAKQEQDRLDNISFKDTARATANQSIIGIGYYAARDAYRQYKSNAVETPTTREDNIKAMQSVPDSENWTESEINYFLEAQTVEERNRVATDISDNKSDFEAMAANPFTAGALGAVFDIPVDVATAGTGVVASNAFRAGRFMASSVAAAAGAGASISADLSGHREVDTLNAALYGLAGGVGGYYAKAKQAKTSSFNRDPAVIDETNQAIQESIDATHAKLNPEDYPLANPPKVDNVTQVVSDPSVETVARAVAPKLDNVGELTPAAAKVIDNTAPSSVANTLDNTTPALLRDTSTATTGAPVPTVANAIDEAPHSYTVEPYTPTVVNFENTPIGNAIRAAVENEGMYLHSPSDKVPMLLKDKNTPSTAPAAKEFIDVRAKKKAEQPALFKPKAEPTPAQLEAGETIPTEFSTVNKVKDKVSKEKATSKGKKETPALLAGKSGTKASSEVAPVAVETNTPMLFRKMHPDSPEGIAVQKELNTNPNVLVESPKTPAGAPKHSLSSLAEEANVKAGVTGDTVSVKQAKSIVSDVFGAPVRSLVEKGRIKFVNSVEELNSLTKRVHPDDVGGFFDEVKNVSYIVLSNVKSGQIAGVVMHEVGVHQGLAKMLGESEWNALKQDVMNIPLVKQYMEAFDGKVPKGLEAEEAIAYFLQQTPTTPEATSLMKRILTQLKVWAREILGGKFVALDEDMLRLMAIDSIKKLDREIGAFVPDAANADGVIDAYLASGKPLDKYSRASILASVSNLMATKKPVQDTFNRIEAAYARDKNPSLKPLMSSINKRMSTSSNPVVRFTGELLFDNADARANGRVAIATNTNMEKELIGLQKNVYKLQEAISSGLKEYMESVGASKVAMHTRKAAYLNDLGSLVKNYKINLKTVEDRINIQLEKQLDDLTAKLGSGAIDQSEYSTMYARFTEEAKLNIEKEFNYIKENTNAGVVKASGRLDVVYKDILSQVKDAARQVDEATLQTREVVNPDTGMLETKQFLSTPETSTLKAIAALEHSESYFTLIPDFKKFNAAISQYGYRKVVDAMRESLVTNYFKHRGITPTIDQLEVSDNIAKFLTYIGSDVSGKLTNMVDVSIMSKAEIMTQLKKVASDTSSPMSALNSKQLEDMAQLLSEINTGSKAANFTKGRVSRDLSQVIDDQSGLTIGDLYSDNVFESAERYIKRSNYEISKARMTVNNVYDATDATKQLLRTNSARYGSGIDQVNKLALGDTPNEYMIPIQDRLTGKDMLRIDFTHNDAFDDLMSAVVRSDVKDTDLDVHMYHQDVINNAHNLFRGGAFDPNAPSDLLKLSQVCGNMARAAQFGFAQVSMTTEIGKNVAGRMVTNLFQAIPELKQAFKAVVSGDTEAIRTMNDLAPVFNYGYDIPEIFKSYDSLPDKLKAKSGNYSKKVLGLVGYNGMARLVTVSTYRTSIGELRDLGAGLIKGQTKADLIKRWADDGLGDEATVMRIAEKVYKSWDFNINEINVDRFKQLDIDTAGVSRFEVKGGGSNRVTQDFNRLNDSNTLGGAMGVKLKRAASEATVGQMPAWFHSRWFNVVMQYNSTAFTSLPAHIQHTMNHRDRQAMVEFTGAMVGATMAYLAKAGVAGLNDEEELAKRLDPMTMAKNIFAMSSYSAIFPKVVDAMLNLIGMSPAFGYASATGRERTAAPAGFKWLGDTIQGVAGVTGINQNADYRDYDKFTKGFTNLISYIPGFKQYLKEAHPVVPQKDKTDFTKKYFLPPEDSTEGKSTAKFS